MVSPVVMFSSKSWELNPKEHQKTYAFELWCWRRCLRVPWTARKSNQSILNEINPEYSLEICWCWNWRSNTLATWFEELTHWKRPWCGKEWGQEEKGMTEDEMVREHCWLNRHEFEKTPGDSEGQGSLACYSPEGHKESETTLWLNNKAFLHLLARVSYTVS